MTAGLKSTKGEKENRKEICFIFLESKIVAEDSHKYCIIVQYFFSLVFEIPKPF